MLRYTFLHLPRIGRRSEARLWMEGVKTWDDLENRLEKQLSLFPNADQVDPHGLRESRQALETEDVSFFAERLPPQEHYRIPLAFPAKTLFLDIETTGLSLYYDYVTVVGWEIDGVYGAFTRGSSIEEFAAAASIAKAVVTFNGSLFDLRFLRKEFPTVQIPQCHVDLRFFARRVGLSGGQKEVEESLGVSRPRKLHGLRGESAPVLWHRYRWGDISALQLLIAYNHADVQGLKRIFDWVSEQAVTKSGAPVRRLEMPRFGRRKVALRFVNGRKDRKGVRLTPYRGDLTPSIVLKDLRLCSGMRVVGIDLTGSEARPSGWCLLDDGYASTARLGSDDEMVDATLTSHATLVSIDSPLSLPRGRARVDDADPTRSEFGITRECERVLKRRGINVYPCLLPSMQQLTSRGIRLAARFRSLGIPVIESYPGAAQDILGIPRKRASLEFLSRGLQQFGISGEFASTTVSHDELDAITSALVGAFFWAGRFEALGNEDEDFLIVPEIATGELRWGDWRVVGLSGPIGSGKTTAAKYFVERGFAYGRYSQVLEQLVLDLGMEVSRESLQSIGKEVNESRGQRWLGRRLLASMPVGTNLVIDGLRHPDDHAFLAETFGPRFIHVAISTSLPLRRTRAFMKGISKDAFQLAIAHPVEAKIPSLQLLAHWTIDNSGTIAELHRAVGQIAAKKNTACLTEAGCP